MTRGGVKTININKQEEKKTGKNNEEDVIHNEHSNS